MYPGNYSDDGFLQPGDRLKDIIKNDRSYLESVNITYQQISDFLDYVIRKRKHSKYKIRMISYMDSQKCPFCDDDGYDSDITIIDRITKENITFSILLPHMIEKHHFSESPNCKHRLDPKKIVEMFDLKPDVNYRLQYEYYYRWQPTNTFSNLRKEDFSSLKKVAVKEYHINKNLVILLFPAYFDFDRKAIAVQ